MFQVPSNFAEFYAQNPTWVRCISLRLLGKKFVDDKVEDLEQELLLFLMSPCSGKSDRIQTFDGSKYETVTAGLFFQYLKNILTRRFISMLESERRRPLDLDIVSIVSCVLDESGHSKPYEIYEDLLPAPDSNADSKLFIYGFRDYVMEHRPDLIPMFDAIMTHDDCMDAGRSRGVSVGEVKSQVRYLRILGKEYERQSA
jgi:hypothetical protein